MQSMVESHVAMAERLDLVAEYMGVIWEALVVSRRDLAILLESQHGVSFNLLVVLENVGAEAGYIRRGRGGGLFGSLSLILRGSRTTSPSPIDSTISLSLSTQPRVVTTSSGP